MILRLYRLTDKFGIFVLKLGAACADWLLESIALLASASRGVFGGLLGIVVAILGFFWSLIRGLGNLIRRLFGMLGFLTPSVSSARERVANRAADAMARRAARDEIDVVIKEDPLKVQNRRLSFLVLILGFAVLGAVIWATDPSRAVQNLPVAPIAQNTGDEDIALEPTADSVAFVVAPTVIPTATPLPEALSARGAIAYTVRERGQTDLWAVNVGSRNPIRITNDASDERDPEWNADGTRLAYAARTEGNWDLYIYDTILNQTGRVTVDLSFQANPTWSPDGVFLAYENYQDENLDIYAVPIDASGSPTRITEDPAPDFSPAWSPTDGREIAFVSLRDGNKDIYIINLDAQSVTNITNTPDVDEDHPVWSPDGRSLAYSAREPLALADTVYIQSLDDLGSPPQLIAIGRAPTFSPDGSSISYAVDTRDGSRTDLFAATIIDGNLPILIASVLPGSTAPTWTLQPLPAALVNSGGLELGVTEPLYIEQTSTFDGEQFLLQSLGNVQVEQPNLSDSVDDSFNALRQAVFEQTNDDYLATLDHAFWRLERPADFGEPGRNWHRTGRAFAIPRNGILGFPPKIEVVRENIGNQTYWRIFVRVDEDTQRGQLGEPLRDIPWDFLVTEENVEAYQEGGRVRRAVPSGYYVDLTQLAADYGWERAAAGGDWIANDRARNYWLFINDNGLTWCQAMLQLYSEGELINYACTG